MGAIGDMSKSERALALVVFLGGLLALMLVPGVERWKIEMWAYAAGGATTAYIGFKSLAPGARSNEKKTDLGTATMGLEMDTSKATEAVEALIAKTKEATEALEKASAAAGVLS